MKPKSALVAASIFGATGVAAGAFGAHALRGFLLSRGMTDPWETAVRYQLVHSVALVALAGWGRAAPAFSPAFAWVVRCWCAGILLFSGSLYLLAAGAAPLWVGPVTPVGGLALIAGWVLLGCAAARRATP